MAVLEKRRDVINNIIRMNHDNEISKFAHVEINADSLLPQYL